MKRLERTKRIEEALKNMTDDGIETWYAIHDSAECQEDGFESLIPREAAQMAVKYGAYEIALIYDNDSDETYATLKLDEID